MKLQEKKEKEERPKFWMRGGLCEFACVVIPTWLALLSGCLYMIVR